MATLYLTEQGALLRKQSRRLIVQAPGSQEVLGEIPAGKVDRVMVFGHVHISTAVIHFLLREGIDTAWFTVGGRLLGRLVPEIGKDVSVRVAQVQRFTDSTFSLQIAQEIVAAKIESSARVLARRARRSADDISETVIRRLRELRRQVRQCEQLAQVRGVEGAAAALYFPALGSLVPDAWRFAKRSRRPPGDPANALLSFGYGVLLNEIAGAVTASGLDPYLGCLHVAEYGRMSLALDLLEEFRAAIIDRLMLQLFNRGEMRDDDFEPGPNGGTWLSASGRKRWLRTYESAMTRAFIPRDGDERTSLRRLLLRQARRMRDTLVEDCPYQAYIAEP